MRIHLGKRTQLALAAAAIVIGSADMSAAQQTVPTPSAPVKVGFTYGGAPWSWFDVKTTANKGAMIDLISAIAKDAGFSVEFHGAVIGDLIPMIQAKVVNVVSAQWTPSAARQAVSDFSAPVVSFGDALLVSKASPPAAKVLADLKGKTVAVGSGTMYEQVLKMTDGITTLSVPDVAAGLAAVEGGKAVGYITTQPSAAFLQQDGDLPADLTVLTGYTPSVFQNVIIAVEKGNSDLLAKINKSLAKFAGDGTLKTVFAKYGVDYVAPKL